MYWKILIKELWDVPFLIIKDPKFVLFAFVILSIGGSGIWAPWLFNIDLSGVCYLDVGKDEGIISARNAICDFTSRKDVSLFQNFPVFMFNLGLLGTLAAQYYITEKNHQEEADDYELVKRELFKVSGLVTWFIALVLSFLALKDPSGFSYGVLISFWLTISIWATMNYSKPDFGLTGFSSILGGDNVKAENIEGAGINLTDKAQEEDTIGGKGLE
ncbi:hypothetical protein ACMXYN_15085 [Neptuniibacter sp. PT8_73]|uniref:hypothetical protein n=1 Tax=Neptuniibacter sp. PT8_73 TaxID=3398206 RepID=UPI0039F50242